MSKRSNPYAQGDARTKSAKAQGYPARSVFKLEEIDARVQLLSRGQRVLDLGAAPGSWSLYACKRVGPQGQVFAIDLQPITQAFPANVSTLQADALTLENSVLEPLAPFDVVLSDMAPATSGNKVRDQALSFELFMQALAVAETYLRSGGHFVGKLFMSGDYPAARAAVRLAFDKEKTIRPQGTRQNSSEVFVVGLARSVPSQ